MTTLRLALSLVCMSAGFGLGVWWLELWPPRTPSERRGTTDRPGEGGAWDPRLGSRPRFVDVTAASGVVFRHENGRTGQYKYLEIMGAGVGILDHDGDGDLDLYFVNGNRLFAEASPEIRNRLYRNDGDWKFTDVTETAGVGDAGYGQGCCVGDFDNDGDPDLYVSNYGPNVLYRNEGDGTFTDISATCGLADPGWGQSCSFLDYDRDGWLDLYVQNYLSFSPSEQSPAFIYVGKEKVLDYPSPLGFKGAPDRLYRNNANGTFTDVTQEVGLYQPGGKGMGVACVDFNADGHVDIFVANDTAENFFFFNRGSGTFQESGLVWGVAFNKAGVPEASMGVDVGDFDADGRPDMIVPCLRRQFFTLYRNMGSYFEDVSVSTGLARATSKATGFNANFLDYDNDADLDIFFTNGGVRMNEAASADASYGERYGIPDILVASDGQGRFSDVSSMAGPYFREALIGRGSAVGDLDNDGDLDLVVCNLADRAVLLRNDTEWTGHWITLELVDARGLAFPLGATVRVVTGSRTQYAVTHGSVTYLSQNDRRLHFGLGPAATIDRLEVTWSEGATRTLENVTADRFLTVQPE